MMNNPGAPAPDDQVSDSAMRSMYEHLGQHGLPGDPSFDTEAGLRDLTSRIRRELLRPADDRELVPALTTSGPATYKYALQANHALRLEVSRLQHAQKLEESRLQHAREDRHRARRAGTLFFAAITAIAAVTITLITVLHQTAPAALAALTAITAIPAVAGTLIHRADVPARQVGGTPAPGADPVPVGVRVNHLDEAIRILPAPEVQMAHAQAREKTDHWYFKGGTGTYLRAVTLPRCLEDPRRRMEFRIETTDPRDAEACRRYDSYRLSRSLGTDRTGDSWTAGQTRLESYATIFAACWYDQHREFATVRVGLTRNASTFRYDMSSNYLIITCDDPTLPAELIPQHAPLFSAYGRELIASFDQAEHLDVERLGQKVRLSEQPGPFEVTALLQSLGLTPPERPLSDHEAAIIVNKALHAKNPYL